MRQHSLKTTYLIHEALVKDENIKSLIDEKNIFLLIAEQEVTFPYCIIRRTGCKSENGNRDFAGDIVSFNIKIYSNKYEEAMEIADAIRFKLEGYSLEDENLRLSRIKFTGASENWVYDSFEQDLSFESLVEAPRN